MELELGAVSLAEAAGERPDDGARAGQRPRHRRCASSVDPGRRRDRGRRAKLKQVVFNLLSNAVKSTPDGARCAWRRGVVGDGGRGDGQRHRRRDRRGGAGADLRGVPARRARCPQKLRGHRPGAGAGKAVRRAARRAALGRERGRRRQHLRLHDPDPAGAPRSPQVQAPRTAARRPRRPGPPILLIEDDPQLGRPAHAVPRRRGASGRGRRATATSGLAPRPRDRSRRPSSWTCCCRRSTAGTCWRELKADPATADDPGGDRVDDRRARQGLRAGRRRVPGEAGRPQPLLTPLARCLPRAGRRPHACWSSTTTRSPSI